MAKVHAISNELIHEYNVEEETLTLGQVSTYTRHCVRLFAHTDANVADIIREYRAIKMNPYMIQKPIMETVRGETKHICVNLSVKGFDKLLSVEATPDNQEHLALLLVAEQLVRDRNTTSYEKFLTILEALQLKK